jgi:CRP-like cAMP-binding protein
VGLVTTSAVLTAVVGLAAQEPLKDLLAALELQMGEEIRTGDLIELKDGSRGVVQAVSWRDTTLRTLDDVLVVVPNTEITQGVVRNLSFHGRVSLRFSVRLDDAYPPGQARRLLEQVVRQHPRVLSDPEPLVRLQAFEESAVAYELQVWQRECNDRALLDLRSELQEQIWYALRREGQRLPSPVRELRPRPRSLDSFPRPLPTLKERCNALANDPLFSVLTPIQLEQLVERSTLVAYGAGETIVQEGAQGQSLFHLLRGQVEVCKQRPGGDSQVVRHLDAGALFGEMTLLLDAPRSATVRATEECLLLEVPRESMAALLENSPELLERFAALAASREAELKTLRRDAQQPQGSLLLERMRRLFVAPRPR